MRYPKIGEYQPDPITRALRDCLNHNYPMGNDRFKAQIEAKLNRKLGHQKPGRPKSKKDYET